MVWMVVYQWFWTFGMVAGIFVEFPNPQKEFKLCGRRNASFVCDPEFILDIGDAERLNQLSGDFRKSTNCLCSDCEKGISMGIFIRRRLTQESIEKYPSGRSIAEMLRKRWHLGKCNDDIVIVVLTEMNISDYSLGKAVQKVFPDVKARQIMKDCKAHFLSGWYYQGLESVVTSFSDVIVKLQKERKSSNISLITGLSLGIGVLLILIIFVFLVLRRQRKTRKKGCSNIYESVPTKNNHENNLNDKLSINQLQRLNSPENWDEEDEDSDEEKNKTVSWHFVPLKRQLSAVVEESEDSETFRDNSFNASYSSQNKNRPLQVTEL